MSTPPTSQECYDVLNAWSDVVNMQEGEPIQFMRVILVEVLRRGKP